MHLPPPPPPPPQTQIHACKRYVCHLPTLVNMPSTHTMRDKERERANEYVRDKFNYTKVKPVFLVFCYDRRKRTEKGNQFAPALSLHSWWKHFRLSSSGCLIALVLALRPGSNGWWRERKKWSSRVLDTVSASHFSQASNHYLHADVYKLAEGFLLIYFQTGNRLRARKSSGSTWRAERESG